MATVNEVLAEAGYFSVDSLIHDWALMIALSKVEQYKAECELFTQKYNLTPNEFDKQIHQRKGSESFEQEDDLDDWEFAAQALDWWQARVEEG